MVLGELSKLLILPVIDIYIVFVLQYDFTLRQGLVFLEECFFVGWIDVP